uniref:TGS domain-containing protein n=1 Tax=Xiphophorus couchianus TaxID=32473 RepID=A0A3B5MQR7_9TELE
MCLLTLFNISIFSLQFQLSPALSERLRVFESLREQRNKNRRQSVRESPLSVRLTNGQTVKGTAGVTTPHYVVLHDFLVCKVNGELWELGRPLEADCELQLLGFDSAEGRRVCPTEY